MNKKTILLVSSVILFVSLLLYYLLGGFRPVTYSVITGGKYIIIGKEYIGVNNSDKLEKLFEEVKGKIETSFPEGILTIVSDHEKYDAENNQVGYFIGISIQETPSVIPEDYNLMEYRPSKSIRAVITSHNLVMPKPDDVRNKAMELAEAEGEELSNYSLERYFDNGNLEVDFLLVK